MGLAPESVGFIVAATFPTVTVTAPMSSAIVARVGQMRLFQAVLVIVAAGCALFDDSSPFAAFAAALLIRCATGSLNPLGSHVLSRVAERVTVRPCEAVVCSP